MRVVTPETMYLALSALVAKHGSIADVRSYYYLPENDLRQALNSLCSAPPYRVSKNIQRLLDMRLEQHPDFELRLVCVDSTGKMVYGTTHETYYDVLRAAGVFTPRYLSRVNPDVAERLQKGTQFISKYLVDLFNVSYIYQYKREPKKEKTE